MDNIQILKVLLEIKKKKKLLFLLQPWIELKQNVFGLSY